MDFRLGVNDCLKPEELRNMLVKNYIKHYKFYFIQMFILNIKNWITKPGNMFKKIIRNIDAKKERISLKKLS